MQWFATGARRVSKLVGSWHKVRAESVLWRAEMLRWMLAVLCRSFVPSLRYAASVPEPTVSPDAQHSAPAMTEDPSQARRHGRDATRPTEIPWRGWLDVLWRLAREIGDDDVVQIAAGVAFWGLMALFPALIATVSVYGLAADAEDVLRQVTFLSRALPWTARSLITAQLTWIAERPATELTLGLVVSVVFAFFSASSGVVALMRGVNAAYDEPETRGWIRQRLLALLFTIGLSLFVILAVATFTLLPAALAQIGFGDEARIALRVARWPTLGVAVMVGLALLYRYAPQRTPPKWAWVTWGAALATVVWILASVVFAAYAENFGRFNKTYGTLGGVVVLLLWMHLSCVAILLGAELNAELEHQTAVDSTIGPPRPMGEREAFAADHLGAMRGAKETKSVMQNARNTLAELNRPGRRKPPGDPDR